MNYPTPVPPLVHDRKETRRLARRNPAAYDGPTTFRGWGPDSLYLCDGGECLCGNHLGAMAKATGRDLSGQPIEFVPPVVLESMRRRGLPVFACETCKAVNR